MAANSNYYGYSAAVQPSQVYGNTMQGQQMTQTAYTGQTTGAYGAQSTTPSGNAYGTASQRSVMPAQSAYTPTAASSYQTSALSGSSYGYTARAQDTTAQSYQTNAAAAYTSPSSYYGRDNSQASSGYDASKTGNYYGQHSGTTQGYGYGSAATKPMYSNYSTPTNTSNQMSSPQTAQKPVTSTASNVSYPYKGQTTGTNYNQNSSSYNSSSNWSGSGNGGYQHAQGYDAAVYNAASSYFQQQTQPGPRQKWGNNKNNNSSNNQNSKPGQARQRNAPRQQQVHYCDVCKISCAGPQTYKEHLEGQKHKKREAAQKQIEAAGPDGYRCSLCDVTCTGTDAFNAHLKGAKHLKTVKLHEKLGKPIPEVQSAEDQDKDKKKDGIVKNQAQKPSFRNNQRRNRKPSAPKITFIGGTTLNSTTGEASTSADAQKATDADGSAATPEDREKKGETPEEGKESKFVGEDYVEEVKSDAGKVIGFECKLCECKFNDTLAREAHLKGRRHQLAYKKKVQPDYVVDQKPSARNRQMAQPRSLMDSKGKQKWEQEMYWRQQEAVWRNEEVRRWGEEEYWRRLEEDERIWEEQASHRHDMEWGHRMGPPRSDFHSSDMYPPPHMSRPRQDSQDDRMVMTKHKQIYPNEQELSAVQSIVSAVEKALKLVSDSIAEEEAPPKVEAKEEKMEVTEAQVEVKTEEGDVQKSDEQKAEGDEKEAETQDEKKTEEEKKQSDAKAKEKIEATPPRTLKGVMRVGVLAKGLLLHERLDVQLVVLCQDRPTTQLLERVSSKLPEQMTKVSDEKYDVVVDDCAITVTTTKEPAIKVLVTLTSPVMRDEVDTAQAEDQKNVLDRDKCLEALASLRHAKWFQAKANGVPSCVVIIRILRDMRDRVPVFTPLNSWALELLVEKCLSSADQPLGPGEAFRRVLECISSGILLPGGPGLHDPCEKELADASKDMSTQEREDLTAAAQHYLRLHAFRQLHKVLGIDPLPPSAKFRGGRYGRGGRFKRRREDSGQSDGSAKKEKKDGEDEEEGGENNKAEGTDETSSATATTSEAPVESKPDEQAEASS